MSTTAPLTFRLNFGSIAVLWLDCSDSVRECLAAGTWGTESEES